MNYNYIVYCLLGTLFPMFAGAQKTITPKTYIAQYKDIAIKEMERSGIPASITLAQGIHESAYGTSTLAKEANNHFGIKCTKDWTGKTYKKWDDEARKSCFRVYTSAEQSYIDHTDFLVNRKHYAFLFDYPTTDYKNWAKGLRKAGYATDPKYPSKLIHTIELYNLSQYDKVNTGGLVVFEPSNTPVVPKNTSIYTRPEPVERKIRTKPASFLFDSYKKGIFRKNGASYVIAKEGESPLDVSIRFGVPYNRLLKFNDLVDGDVLLKNQYVYISPKRNNFKDEETFHKVEQDERMYEIAQYYGIKLAALLERNLLLEGMEPQNGEMIKLKEKADDRPLLRPRDHIDKLPEANKKVNNNAVYKPVISSKTIERPKPENVELNTPVYDKKVYTKKTTLNTTLNKDSIDFGKKDISIDTDTTWMYLEDTEPSNNNNNNTYSGTLYTPTTTDVSKNTETVVDSPKINKAALFSGGTGSTDTTLDEKTTSISTSTDINKVSSEDSFIMHEVQEGETLYRLFLKYKVSVEEIKTVNNLSNNTITPKQQLKIPQK